MVHTLFVCTGNICRSPIAERLAAKCSTQLGADFSASSAGIRAVIAHPIHPHAAHFLQSMGCDASNFSARQLTRKTAESADLVLTMTKGQRDEVLEQAPRVLRKTFTMEEAALLVSEHQAKSVQDMAALRPLIADDEVPDIFDPIGQSADVFCVIGHQIASALESILGIWRHQ